MNDVNRGFSRGWLKAGECWIVAWRAAALFIGLLAAASNSTRADICCNCSSASLAVSSGQVNLNEPVTITYTASYCRCVGGPCWHPEGNCSLAPVDVQVFLEGFGQVHSQTINFAPTNDFNIGLTQPFQYTPTVSGQYTVVAAGTCPSASAQFSAGCDNDCSTLGGPNPCPNCGSIAAPTISANKTDNIIRTVCPTDCKAQKDDAHGETVTVLVTAPGVSVDCYELTLNIQGAVKVLSQPGSKGSWPGVLLIELQGLVGLGSASIEVKLYKFDDENQCWMTSSGNLTLQAKPDDDCECPTCAPGGGRGLPTGGAIRAAPVLGEVQLGDVRLSIRAGQGNLLRIPQIVAVHPNGDVEALLPELANSVIFRPGSGFLENWILGGAPGGGSRADFVQLSNIAEGLTYFFESTPGGVYPFRLQRIKRFDFTNHSTYIYDANDRLSEIRVGSASSTTYFGLSYDAANKLTTVVPWVDGVADMVRAVQLVYDGDSVIGADGAVCSTCNGGERRRFYFNAQGLLTRVTDSAGNDLELFTYDAQGRLTVHQRLNTDDVMVVVKTVEYVGDLRGGSTVTIHERISDAQERIRVEHYDDHGRIVQIDRYPDLFPHDSTPSGEAQTTMYGYALDEDPGAGITTETTQTTDPAGVSDVTVVKTFENGAPLVLPLSEDGGWRLPIDPADGAFETAGFQQGDAVLSPLVQGAAGVALIEVTESGVYDLRALLHEAANPGPTDSVCVRFSITGGAGGFADGYVHRDADDPPAADPWLRTYTTSCAQFEQAGFEHPGWMLERGVTYTLTLTLTELGSSPNPADGYGIDGLALTRSGADPAGLAAAPYSRIDGLARYIIACKTGAGGEISKASMVFSRFDAGAAAFLNSYAVDERNGRTDFVHDPQGLLLSVLEPAVTLLDGGGTVRRTTTYEYDDNNRLTRTGRTNSQGLMTYAAHEYDVFGRRTLMIEDADGAPPAQAVTGWTYNIYGELTGATDPCGNATATFYGSGGKAVDEIAYESGSSGPLLRQTHYDYDLNLRLTRVRAALHDGSFAMDAPAGWADTTFTHDLFGRQLSRTDPDSAAGLTTSFEYNYQEQTTAQFDPDGSIKRIFYDGLGRIVQTTVEGAGIAPLTTAYTYNDFGQLSVEYHPDKGATLYEYDNLGRRTATVRAARAELTYDSSGQVVRVLVKRPMDQSPVSDVVTDYDELGRRIRERARRTIGADGPDDPVSLIAYDPAGLIRAQIDKADGNSDDGAYENGDRRTVYDYNDLGRRISQINAENDRIDFLYDACGRALSQTIDPGGLNLVTAYLYDALGRQVRVADPEGHYTVSDYNSRDQVIRETSYGSGGAALQRVIFQRDAADRVVRRAVLADPDRATIDTSADSVEDQLFDARGLRTQVSRYVNGAPTMVQHIHDGMGRTAQVRMPELPDVNYTEVVRSAGAGLVESVVRNDPLGQRQTTFEYDEYGRRTREVRHGAQGDPDRVISTAYDPLDRTLTSTGWDGKRQLRMYDTLGRVVAVVDDDGRLARRQEFEYDRLGNVITITAFDDDGPPQVTTYAYDTLGRNTHRSASNGAAASYVYDAGGRVVREIDPRGFAVDYGYDGRGLMISRAVDDPGFEPFHVSENFAYDGLGNVTLARRSDLNQTQTEYNALGYLIRQRQTVDGVEKTVDYQRSQLGQRTALTIPDGPALTYEYNALGMNTLIRRGGAALVGYAYAGRYPLARQLASSTGTTVELDWDYGGHRDVVELANRSIGAGGRDLIRSVYERNLAGYLSREASTYADAGASNVDYQYDTLRRLTSADYSGSRAGTEEFDYDILSNRRSYNDRFTGPAAPGLAYEHDEGNQYTSIGGAPLSHDGAGNIAADEDGYVYSYDFANRIVEMRDSGGSIVAAHEYDAMGRRVVSVIGGRRIRYYYDDNVNVLAEYGGNGGRLRYYVDGTAFRDEHAVVHDDAAGADFFYALQNNGTVAGLIDEAGNLVETYVYDAYGAVTIDPQLAGDHDGDGDLDLLDFMALQNCFGDNSPPQCRALDADDDGDVDLADYASFAACSTGPRDAEGFVPPGPGCLRSKPVSDYNSYFFTGRTLDVVGDGLQVQWNRSRYYSPRHGRWYSTDPLGLDEGPNLYEYARSAPQYFVDPQGMAVTINTPWANVVIGDGCGGIQVEKSESKSWWFFAGRLKVSAEIKASITGQVCKKCCKKPTLRVGEEVWEIDVTGSLEGSGTVEFRPWGLYEKVNLGWFGEYEVDGWLGLTVAGTLSGSGSGTIRSDLCNNSALAGSVCVKVGGALTVSGGGELIVKDTSEDDPLFNITAAVRGQISGDVTNCYQCAGSTCGWSGWKPCVQGKVWVEFKLLKWGLSVDLIKGNIFGCD